jgi:EVE domain
LARIARESVLVKCWVNTISRDHVWAGVVGGFTQAGHGKSSGVKRLSAGDWILFYSPKTSLQGGQPVKAFTAIGLIADDQLYQLKTAEGFAPWRRNVEFLDCVETPIRPLIDTLSFIKDKQHWGYMFRFGLFEIPQPDFELIKNEMTTTKLKTVRTPVQSAHVAN